MDWGCVCRELVYCAYCFIVFRATQRVSRLHGERGGPAPAGGLVYPESCPGLQMYRLLGLSEPCIPWTVAHRQHLADMRKKQ